MSSKINYIFNQGFQDTFTPGYTDSSGGITSQSTTKQGSNISYISDNNLVNRSSTEKGLGEYFDVSFSTPFDLSNLESIIVYSAPEIKNYLIQKIRYETIGNVKLDVSEIQLWVDNENILTTDKLTSFYQTSNVSSLANAFDNNINTRAETNVGVGEYFDMSFVGFDLSHIQSLIVYNNTPNNETRLLLYDDSDNIIILNNNSSNINHNDNIIKFKGESYEKYQRKLQTIRIKTNDYSTLNLNEIQIWVDNSNIAPTATITQSSILDASANVNDSSLNSFARTQKGFGEFIDVSLNYPIAANRIQSVIVYSDILQTNNPLITKIRIETVESHSLEIEEVQIWKDSSNIISDFTGVLSTSINDVSLAFDGSFNTYAKTNTGIGEYIDLSSNTGFNYNDLQTIVVYTNNGLDKTKIILYDDSNIPVTEHYNTDNTLNNLLSAFFFKNGNTIGSVVDAITGNLAVKHDGTAYDTNSYLTSDGLSFNNDADYSEFMRLPDVSIPSNGEFSILIRYYPTLAPVGGSRRKIWYANISNNIEGGHNFYGTLTYLTEGSPGNENTNLYYYEPGSPYTLHAFKLTGAFVVNTWNTLVISLRPNQQPLFYLNGSAKSFTMVSGSGIINNFGGETLQYFANKFWPNSPSYAIQSAGFSFGNIEINNPTNSFYQGKISTYLVFDKLLSSSEASYWNTTLSSSELITTKTVSKFNGPNSNSTIPRFNRMRFDTTTNAEFNINEMQVWITDSSKNFGLGTSYDLSSINIMPNATISANIDSSSNLVTNINDNDFSTYIRTLNSSNSFIDVTFDKPYDVSALSSVIAYSFSLGNTNPLIGKMSIESTTNNSLDISEIQVWYDNSNVAKVVDVSSSNMFDGSIQTNKLKHGPDTKYVKVARLNKIIPAVTETLVATKSVSNNGSYNNNKMNFPQSIFNGAMGSNSKNVTGLTGSLSIFNGTHSLSWSADITSFSSGEPLNKIFSASSQPNQYTDSNWSTMLFGTSKYSNTKVGQGYPYTGSRYITYYQDDGTAVNVNGVWFAYEFPGYVNFTVSHHYSDDWSRAGTYVGRDANGINRLLGSYENSWNDGGWRGISISNNYYVNKIYLVVTKSMWSNATAFRIMEIFFDGQFLVSTQSSEQDDFYNDGTNTLYNNSLVNLNTWAGSNTVYLAKLYNQSSIKTTPLIQPVEANQPTIDVSDLKINFDGTNSFMYAETSTELLESGDDTYSYATTASSNDDDNGNVMGFSSASQNMRSQLLFNNSGNLKLVGASNDTPYISLTENTEYNIVATIDNSLSNNVNFWIDNSSNTATSIAATSGTGGGPSNLNLDNTNFYVGSLHYGGNNYEKFNGYAKSYLVFNKTLDTSSAALFHSKDYYSSNITPYVNEINEESSLVGGYSLYILNNNNNISLKSALVDVSFVPFNYDSLQSIIIYENSYSDLSNLKLTFFDGFNNELFFFDTSSNPYNNTSDVSNVNIFKIKGKDYNSSVPKLKNFRFSTTDYAQLSINEVQLYVNDISGNVLSNTSNFTITQSSTFNTDLSSQLHDQNFGTFARTQKGFNEFIDISLNEYYDVSNIQAIIAYSTSQNDSNPTISKIRYQTTSDVKLKIGEFQVWVDNSNIASNIDNSSSSIDGIYDLSYLNDSNLYTYVSTNQGIGEYIDISLNNYFSFNDLQGIVTYVDESVGTLDYQKTTKLILYDDSNVPIIELSNNIIDDPNLYFSYNASTNTFAGGTLINLTNYTPLIGNAPRTIEAFVSTTNTGPQFIISTGYGGVNNYFGIRTVNGKVGLMGFSNDVLSNLNIADGNSHRVVVSYNGLTTVKIFVDNQVETLTLPNGQLNTTSGGNHIGGTTLHVNPSPRDYWNGTIGNVKIYDIYISSLSHLDNYNIYKYKGPSHVLNRRQIDHFRLETINYSTLDVNEIQMWVDGSNILHDLSSHTISHSLQSNDTSSTLFNNNNLTDGLRIDKGLGKFIDISLNTPLDVSKLESIVYYSDIKKDYNPPISKVRIESIGSVAIDINEIQLWKDNTNIISNFQLSSSSTNGSSTISNLIDNTLDTNLSTNIGIGEYIDVLTDNSLNFNDIQSIVTFIDPSASDLSNQQFYRVKLYDDSNVPFIIIDNSEVSTTSSIHKYNGPTHNTLIPSFSNLRIETIGNVKINISEIQLWVNGENIIANKKFQDQITETLVATKSVTMPSNYNGNLMNFPQSIFNGAMGSNTKTVSGLTGNLSVFNGSYLLTWSPNHVVPYSSNQAHYMFSATNHTNQYGNGDLNAQFRYLNESVPYNSSGNYTGNNYITYQDDDGNSINANGEWIALEFPAYINFTKVHHILIDSHVNIFTWIGRDKNGINRLVGTYSMSWNNGFWRSATFNNNYFVNKLYFVITKKHSGLEYMTVSEIFFDGNYEVSPAQTIYPNNSIITASSTNGTDISSNIVDSKFNTYFLSEKSLGEFIDLSLNTPVNFSDIQSILLSSSPINNNPKISKIKYETTSNVKLELNEFQVWVDNLNISNQISNHLSSKSGIDLSNVYDSDKNSYYVSDQGIGEYIQFDLSNLSFNYNNLQSIIIYNYGLGLNDLSNLQSTKLTLYDDSNIPVIEYSNSPDGNNYTVYKYKGPSYNHQQLRNIRLTTTDYTDLDINEIQIWYDQSNILQQGNYTLTIKDSSENTYSSSVFTDANLNTVYNLEKGLGHFIDISLNNTIDVSKLESVVIYSDLKTTKNSDINKIRFETTKNVPLQFNEIQIWRDNSNLLSNFDIIQETLDLSNTGFEEPDLSSYPTSESLIDTNRNFKKIIIDNSENSLHISEVQVWKDNSNIALFGTASITNSKYDPTAAGYSVIVDDYGATSPTNSGWKNFAANERVFIILNNDGSIEVYGTDTNYGATAPTDTFSSIYSASSSHDNNLLPNLQVAAKTNPTRAFAGVTTGGELRCWGTFQNSNFNGLPTTNDFSGSKIFFTQSAACALKSDGSVETWGRSSEGGTGNDTHTENNPIPTDNGYTAVYASQESFTAIKDDGTVAYWGWASKNYIGTSGAPASVGTNAKITVNNGAFVALKTDGTLLNWGTYGYGGGHATRPSGTYSKVIATRIAFIGLKTDGSIVEWGTNISNNPPSGNNYVDIFTIYDENIIAVKSDGTLVAWGGTHPSVSSLPTDNDFLNAKFVTHNTYNGSVAALKSDGTVVSWGGNYSTGAPTNSGYVDIFSTSVSFLALHSDSSISIWGNTQTNNFQNATNIKFSGVWSFNGNGVEVGYYLNSPNEYKANSAIDNVINIGDFSQTAIYNSMNTVDNSGTWELDLSESVNYKDLQSIVVYNRMDTGGQSISDKMKTIKISLVDFSGRTINEISPNSINFAYKIKGGSSETGYTSTESINYDVSRIIADSVTNTSGNFDSDSVIRSNTVFVHNLDAYYSLAGWNTDNFILLRGNNTYHGNQNITYGNQILGLRKNQYISKNISSLDSGGSYKIEFYNHKQNNTLNGQLSILKDNSQINNLTVDSSDSTLNFFYFIASDTSHNIEFRNTSSDNNSIIWIDNFTFKKTINKLTDNDINTYHTESQQLGAYLDINLSTLNLNYKDIQSIVTYNYGNGSYDLSNQYATKLILYDDSNVPFIEYNNDEYINGISSTYNVYKYKGPKHDTSIRGLKKIRFETEASRELGINEIQVWKNNENVFKYGQEPTSSFILNGDSKSLTDLYSSVSLTLNGNPGFDNDGVHLIGSQYITIPQSILEFGSDNFTISLWTHTYVASGTPHILSLGYNNTNSWLLGSDGSVIQLYGYQQTSTGDGDTDFNFTTDNQTNNYIISRVGNKMKLFINGVQKLDLDISVSLPTQDYHIGYSLSNGSYYSGIIKRLDIWKNYGFSS